MWRTQCVLALATLYLGLVHSWDIAVSVGDHLEFYTDGTKTDTVTLESHNLTAITYDEVHNMMLFVDKQSDNDAICGYNLSSKNISCFVRRFGSDIHDLTFDPATDLLFFTDKKERSVNWISLKQRGSQDVVYGDSLIKMYDRTPTDIAVDSCTGTIYWTNTQQRRRGNYMETARINGSYRHVVGRTTPVNSFALDLQTQNTYFFTGIIHNLLNKGHFRVNDIMAHRKMIFNNKPRSAQELTVSKDYLYWTQSLASKNTVWQMLKNASLAFAEPKVIKSNTGHTLSIAANYRIEDQVHGLQDCEALARLIPILEKDQTTELYWSTDSTETETEEISDSTLDPDWSTDSTETETEEISDSTSDPDWSTDSTETPDLSSTADPDWSTDSTETPDLSSTADPDWSTDSTETPDLSSTADPDWSTDSTETPDLSSTADPDWSTDSTETSDFSSIADPDRSTDSTETPDLSSTADPDWSTDSTTTSDFSSTADPDWSTDSTETSDLSSTADPDRSTDSTTTSDLSSTADPDWCKVSECHNFCFQDNCSLNEEGQPKCRCNAGYSGARCEVHACHGYCLNNGACSLNQQDEPVCQCVGNHEGTRCETVKKHSFSYTPQIYPANRNLTLADLVSNWRKPAVKVSVVVEV